MECSITLEDVESVERWVENIAVKHMNDGYVTVPGMLIVLDTLYSKIEELKTLLNKQE